MLQGYNCHFSIVFELLLEYDYIVECNLFQALKPCTAYDMTHIDGKALGSYKISMLKKDIHAW
jgi:hypothetical protein